MSREASLRVSGEALASILPPLLVDAERIASTLAQGLHGRKQKGMGESFWQFRRYQPGDSMKDIDWRRSARSDPLYVRENEWAGAQTVWFWCDVSPSMDYQSDKNLPTKAERAKLLTMALAVLLVRGGERVGLIGADMPPSNSQSTLARFAHALEHTEALETITPPSQHTETIFISDFLDPPAQFQAALARLATSGIRGHALQVLDPAEETLPFTGRIRFQGTEADGETLIGSTEDIRAEYLNRLAAHKEQHREIAQRFGWTFRTHHTETSAQSALLTMFEAIAGDGG